MWERFKCFNVNFRLLKTIYVHLLVCYLNKLQNARCNDKDVQPLFVKDAKRREKLTFFVEIQTTCEHKLPIFQRQEHLI